jgi:4-azaleucine resistance transporter AzlC
MSIEQVEGLPGGQSGTRWRQDFALGLWHMAPLLVGMIPFGLLMGALAAQKGFGLVDMLLMSGIVFAGASQFVAIELWRDPIPMLLLIAATGMVNLRHVIMGAALQPVMGRFGKFQTLAALFLMADEIWALSMRRAADRALTPAYYFGLGIPLYVNWLFWTALGLVIGGVIRDPSRYGFDFAFTAVFLVLIVGLWRGRTSIPPLVASAAAALAAHAWLPGVWYIVLGGLAGALAGAFSGSRQS